MEVLRTLSADELNKLAIDSVKLEKRAKDANTAHKSSFPAVGKLVCVFEERLNTLKSQRMIASNTSLATYWESITKTRVNNHALSCSVAFGTYVRTELITERDYDLNSAQCLELAASISTAVGGDITAQAVHDAAEQLKERGKDAAKSLRAILDKVKEHKTLSADKAAEMLKTIFAEGHLLTVISLLGAEIAYLTDEKVAKQAFHGIIAAHDMFGRNVTENGDRRFSDDTLNAWLEEKEDFQAPVKFVTADDAEETAEAAA
ncbi:MAG TPA: hypothetical protein VFA77_01675 [Candidatus Eisenbacteria bacterium]|nr:hypothetical protein [Candidatus Eisenbacteria bacterium]